jgi:hypothetical protein
LIRDASTKFKRGDLIKIKVLDNKSVCSENKVSVSLISVNGDKLIAPMSGESFIKLTLVGNAQPKEAISMGYGAPAVIIDNQSLSARGVDFKKAMEAPNTFPMKDQFKEASEPLSIQTKISYLNLSKMDKDSSIYSLLEHINIGDSMVLKSHILSESPAFKNTAIECKVVSDSSSNTRVISTPFGLVETEKASELPIGVNLKLYISSINGKELFPSYKDLRSAVTNFLVALNTNIEILEHIFSSFKKLPLPAVQRYSRIKGNSKDSDRDLSIYQSLDNNQTDESGSLSPKIAEVIDQLSDKVEYIKHLIAPVSSEGSYAWRRVYLRVEDRQEDNSNTLFVKNLNNTSRFLLNVTNDIQLDGLLYFTESKKVGRFELVVRFKKTVVDRNTEEGIAEIFMQERGHRGVDGSLSFQYTEDFLEVEE